MAARPWLSVRGRALARRDDPADQTRGGVAGTAGRHPPAKSGARTSVRRPMRRPDGIVTVVHMNFATRPQLLPAPPAPDPAGRAPPAAAAAAPPGRTPRP